MPHVLSLLTYQGQGLSQAIEDFCGISRVLECDKPHDPDGVVI